MEIQLRPSGVILGLVVFSLVLLKAPFEGAFMGVNMEIKLRPFGLILGLAVFPLVLLKAPFEGAFMGDNQKLGKELENL